MPWDIHKTTIDVGVSNPSQTQAFRVQAAQNPIIQFTGSAIIASVGLEIITEYSVDGSQWENLETITLAAGLAIGAIQDLIDLSADDTVTRSPYFRWTIQSVNNAPFGGSDLATGTMTTSWWIDDISNDGVGEL